MTRRVPKPHIRVWLRAAAGLLAAAPLFAQALTILTSSLPDASVGVFYAQGFTVSGGVAPFTWSATGNVPPGLTVQADGLIVGTPTAAGSYNFTAKVVDSRQASTTRTVTMNVAAGPPLSITTKSPLPGGTVGQSYSVTLSATGGSPPYQWSATFSAAIPAGLTLNASTGVLSGTPSASGNFSFTVQVTDSNKGTANTTFALTITGTPLSITTAAPLFAGTVGVAYSQPFSAAGGTAPYTWSVKSGDTGGLTLTSAGALQGTPQNAGTFNFTVQVTDSAGATASQAYSLQVSQAVITITVSGTLPPGAVGVDYNARVPVAATGGTPPYTWSVASGAVPGLDFDATNLVLSGTPVTPGAFNVTLQVKDAKGGAATRALPLTIAAASLSIDTARQLTDGALNASYTTTLSASGGAPPYSWTATGLPAGLSINTGTGEISGTPTAAGNFPIAVTVTDSALTHVSDRFTLNVKLPPAPAVTFSGLSGTVDPGQQFPLQIRLASAFPAPITGQAILTFSPESGPVDKTVQFASGGTVANFSVATGDTAITSTVPMAIQTGTVAGTINVSLRLQAGGIDITPSSAPVLTAQISRAAPVIKDVQVTRASGSVRLAISGYTTAREVTQAVFNFVAASGQTLQSTASSITVPVDTLFGSWFADSANAQYGSQFLFTQPFTVQGDANSVIPDSVTLTNRVGSTTFKISR